MLNPSNNIIGFSNNNMNISNDVVINSMDSLNNLIAQFKYTDWLSDGTKPIYRSHSPYVFDNNRYEYNINTDFDILQEFMILLDNPEDINEIREVRLEVGTCSNGFKVPVNNFIKISEFCYKIQFIIEKETDTDFMFPLISIIYHKNLILSVFVKNKLSSDPKIVCRYYNVLSSIRRELGRLNTTIDTNHGPIKIMSGFIGCGYDNYIFSYSHNDSYNKIHDLLYAKYYDYKILHGHSFESKIKYNDVKDMVDNHKDFCMIIEGLCFEWRLYCVKSGHDYTIYF